MNQKIQHYFDSYNTIELLHRQHQRFFYMKSFVLFILLPFFSLSQNYQKTLKADKEWDICEPIGMGAMQNTRYTISCDTTILSKTYYNIYSISYQNPSPSFTLTGFVREDTLAQKLYFLDSNAVQEELIVDYSLGVGDSFMYRNNNYEVVLIDTQFIASGVRKVIHFEGMGTGPYLRFIEGVGNGFWGIANNHIGWGGGEAVCSVLDNSSYSCAYILPVYSLEDALEQSRVYPNPFSTSFTIDIKTRHPSQDYLGIVYTSYGKKVATLSLYNQKEIDLKQLATGIYYLKIPGFKPIKLIKQ